MRGASRVALCPGVDREHPCGIQVTRTAVAWIFVEFVAHNVSFPSALGERLRRSATHPRVAAVAAFYPELAVVSRPEWWDARFVA